MEKAEMVEYSYANMQSLSSDEIKMIKYNLRQVLDKAITKRQREEFEIIFLQEKISTHN